ncbi:MAG: PTS system mannose/fructose/sorbose family transporter subunit IID [Enterobacteriaceae bacterium]
MAQCSKNLRQRPAPLSWSLKRNSQFFNTNHLAPFIMGLTLSMEKRYRQPELILQY